MQTKCNDKGHKVKVIHNNRNDNNNNNKANASCKELSDGQQKVKESPTQFGQ